MAVTYRLGFVTFQSCKSPAFLEPWTGRGPNRPSHITNKINHTYELDGKE